MKFIRRDYTAFVGIPSTRAEIQDYMCSEIADMIVSSETGWEYDTRTPNKTAFSRLPVGTTSQPEPPVLYFRNTISGCKMMVTSILFNLANTDTVSTSYDPTCRSIFMKGKGHNANRFASGIGISIIPAGDSGEFPDSYTSSTELPSGALPVICENCGTYSNDSRSASYWQGYMARLFSGSGMVVSYGISIDEYSVTLFGGSGSSTRGSLTLIYTVGKVFGTLAYDSSVSSQYYGALRFYNVAAASPSNMKDGSYYGLSPLSSTSDAKFDYSNECFDESGNLLYCQYCIIGDQLLSTKITNSQTPDFIRWQPGIVYNPNANTPIYEGGDNFKGYLDTNLIRYAIATPGQLFNNGQFCCVADNLLMKWDPDAEDTINA